MHHTLSFADWWAQRAIVGPRGKRWFFLADVEEDWKNLSCKGKDSLAQRRKDAKKNFQKRGSALRLCAFAREFLSLGYFCPGTDQI
jgi:hypothetical protein